MTINKPYANNETNNHGVNNSFPKSSLEAMNCHHFLNIFM